MNRRDRTAHTIHQLEQIARASLVAADLAERGHELLNIRLGGVKPVIEVRPTRACDDLEAAPVRCTQIDGTRVRVAAAPYGGCQVEWAETN